VVSRLLLMSEDACSSLISLAYGSDQIVDERTEKPVELSQFASNGELDWNERFQQVLASKNERDDIGTLAKDFADASCALAKTIVEEMFAVKRTYHPKSVGGIAGGPKFIENGIFVKLSCDWKGLYGGDSWAIKSASKELLGVETYLDLRIKNLHFPLLALVQYRGHALLCQVGDIFGFTRSERFFFFFFFFFFAHENRVFCQLVQQRCSMDLKTPDKQFATSLRLWKRVSNWRVKCCILLLIPLLPEIERIQECCIRLPTWKVSSKSWFDFLKIWINQVILERMEGEPSPLCMSYSSLFCEKVLFA
jgi:hypothetical protein